MSAQPDAMANPDMSDEELLARLASERTTSIGFDHDSELSAQREQALNYMKGEMPDLKVMPNRSTAVSTDVADAIETALPDLIEIFTGGDDVVTFAPVGAEDEAAAKQETDYINHVFFHENDGFLNLYTGIKDALSVKTGIFKFWWQDSEHVEEESFTGKTLIEAQMAAEYGDLVDVREYQDEGTGELLVDFTVRRTSRDGRAVVVAVPPEDFTVAADTVKLADTHYCAMRTRPRAQQLIADGFDADDVARLPSYSATTGEAVDLARDTADEHSSPVGSGSGDDLRTVEIVEHVIRLPAPNGGLQLWRVVTGGDETVILRRDKIEGVGFAALCPYLVPHRFYGQSLAEKLIEVQKVKTAVTRMLLDSGWFALNQRMEVADDASNEYTISDLLRNEPGLPVRSKNGNAVKAIGSPGLSFDVFGALEYFSTVAEQRTGVVRNAQGLNPDTLHDTAKGALAMMREAQKRLRLIARILAETGLKDLFLGLHALIRENATKASRVKLQGDWKEIDPTSWAARNNMTVEVGVGSGGKDHDLATIREIMAVQEKLAEAQGGLSGPFVTEANVYNTVSRLVMRAGMKSVEPFFADPSRVEKPEPAAPPPDPEALRAQAEMQLQQAKLQNSIELARVKAESDAQLAHLKLENERQIAAAKLEGETALARWKYEQELQLKREEMQSSVELQALRQQLEALRGPLNPDGLQEPQFGGEIG